METSAMRFRFSVLLGLAAAVSGCSPNSSEPPGMSDDPASQNVLPCEVKTIFDTKCGMCHGVAKTAGAPMSLVSWGDVQGNSLTAGHEGKKIFQRVAERINDPSNPMPPRIYAQLTEAEKALLMDWTGQGAPPGLACQPPAGAGGMSGAGGVPAPAGGGPGAGGAVAAGGAGGSLSTGGVWGGGEDSGLPQPDPVDIPVEPDPSECTYVEFRARKDAAGTPFDVPQGPERYVCFGFNVPEFAANPTQGLAFYTINEAQEAPTVHHWLLYQSITPQANGVAVDCLGTHLDASLVAGWAPGATPWFLPAHVGVGLGANFILEIHYSNAAGPATTDSSGVRVCTTQNLRPQTASVSWLGSDFFPAIPPQAKGHVQKTRCTPNVTEPIHVLRTWPHMHMLGRRMQATLIRGSERIPYHDEPFDFNYQIQYDTPFVMQPGDSIETACTWDNATGFPVGFGEATTQEMCYNFTVAYPAHALVNALPSVHTNACLNEPAF